MTLVTCAVVVRQPSYGHNILSQKKDPENRRGVSFVSDETPSQRTTLKPRNHARSSVLFRFTCIAQR
jgi:hypothetical protein